MGQLVRSGVAIVALASPAFAVTIHVPADQPTIQAAIAAAGSGDVVEVACGTYYEHDLLIQSLSNFTLRSAQGTPGCVTIDAQGLGRCLSVWGASGLTLSGLTLARGTAGFGLGANLSIKGGSAFVFDCAIVEGGMIGPMMAEAAVMAPA
jgi:hypothetical protein